MFWGLISKWIILSLGYAKDDFLFLMLIEQKLTGFIEYQIIQGPIRHVLVNKKLIEFIRTKTKKSYQVHMVDTTNCLNLSEKRFPDLA
jgi:hypothetical protein